MKKEIVLAAIPFLLLSGCHLKDNNIDTLTSSPAGHESTDLSESDPQTSQTELDDEETDIINTGYFYPKLDDNIISQAYTEGCYGIYNPYLYYNGEIYSSYFQYRYNSVNTEDNCEIDINEILDEEIGSVYSNNDYYWSEDKEKLQKVTSEGKLYKIKGFDDTYRLGVVFHVEIEPTSPRVQYDSLIIFDKNNDMLLHNGDDLFIKRLKLQNALVLNVTKYELNESEDKWEIAETKELTTEDIDKLLSEWKDAVFYPDNDEKTDDNKIYYRLEFLFSGGLHTMAFLYEDGTLSIDGISAKVSSKKY